MAIIGEINRAYRPRKNMGWHNHVKTFADIAVLELHNDDGRSGMYLIDPDDAEVVSQCRWQIGTSKLHYAITSSIKVNGSRVSYPLQRLVCPGAVPGDGMHVDHLNSDTTDNRKSNLELVTPRENSLRIQADNPYGRGISVTEDGRFRAYVAPGPRMRPPYNPSFKYADTARDYRRLLTAAYERGQYPTRDELYAVSVILKDQEATR